MTGGSLGTATATVTRLWPWRRAAAIAGVVFVVWLAFSVLGGEFRGIYIAGPVALALFVFFLVGALDVLMAQDRQGERRGAPADVAWALAHPWLFGTPPAIATAVTVFAARRALTLWGLDETLLSSAVDGLARGAILLVIVGLTGTFTRGADKTTR